MYRYSQSRATNNFRPGRVITNDELAHYAPAVLADEAHDSRGDRYRFIPTIQVLDRLRQEGFQPFEVAQTKCRDKGKIPFTRHMLRLRHESTVSENGNTPELVLLNSHDGTSSYQLLAGYFRSVCSNGLITGDVQTDIRVRHTGGQQIVDDVIDGSFTVLKNLDETTKQIAHLSSIQLLEPERQILAKAASALRWDADNAPVSAQSLLRPRRHQDDKQDLWTTFNTVQENVLKGGHRYLNQDTGRYGRTRSVNSVNENVRLNRALWTLTTELAALKAA